MYFKAQVLNGNKIKFQEIYFFRLIVNQDNELETLTTEEEHYYKLWRMSVRNATRLDENSKIESEYRDFSYERLIQNFVKNQNCESYSEVYLLNLKNTRLGRMEFNENNKNIYMCNNVDNNN